MSKFLQILFLVSAFQLFGQTSLHIVPMLNNDTVEIDVLRMYLTDLEIYYVDGSTYTDPTTAYLLDIEEPSSLDIRFSDAPQKTPAELRFRVGTDSSLNVAGILDGALDPIKGMYWAWNTGYINFKIEGKAGKQPFEYHIGGYLPPYTTDRLVRLPVNDSLEMTVYLNPFPWLQAADVYRTPSVLIPGEKASNLADEFPSLFLTAGHE